MAGFVSGTLTSLFLSVTLTFRVSAVVAISLLVYMRVFLAESNRAGLDTTAVESSQPILTAPSKDRAQGEAMLQSFGKGNSLRDIVGLLRSSVIFSRAAVLAFLCSIGGGGINASLLYYLKAQFHFNKDQFADLSLLMGTVGAVSQLLLMPILVPAIGEKRLLSIALLASCTHVFLYSIAWASWVPYFAAMFVVISIFSEPCTRSIVSKIVGSHQQGMAQGCISGIQSFASILSPLAFTPLTALFLSESAPFYFPGFSIMCAGFVLTAAFIQSLIMARSDPAVCSHKFSNTRHVQP